MKKTGKYDINDVDKRTITINEYNPDKKHDISIYKFSDLLNSFVTSKNALDICNSLGCNSIEIQQKSLDYGLTYKNVFNGDNNSASAKKVLDIIKCDAKPKLILKTYKSISYIKWKIIEFNKKTQQNDDIAEWIGLLAGLVLYFDELDELNYNTTTYAKDICIPLTVNLI
jgi:hypothetical protein